MSSCILSILPTDAPRGNSHAREDTWPSIRGPPTDSHRSVPYIRHGPYPDSRTSARATPHSTTRASLQAHHTPPDRPARTHAHPHRSQALPAEPHRAAPGKPQQSKAAPRRAGPYEVGVAGSRGIGRGAPEDSFAPTQYPTSPSTPLPQAPRQKPHSRSKHSIATKRTQPQSREEQAGYQSRGITAQARAAVVDRPTSRSRSMGWGAP